MLSSEINVMDPLPLHEEVLPYGEAAERPLSSYYWAHDVGSPHSNTRGTKGKGFSYFFKHMAPSILAPVLRSALVCVCASALTARYISSATRIASSPFPYPLELHPSKEASLQLRANR